MVETLQCFFDIIWHGEIDMLILVIPFEVDSAECCSLPIDGNIIMFLESGDEVFSSVSADVLDAKIIYDQGK